MPGPCLAHQMLRCSGGRVRPGLLIRAQPLLHPNSRVPSYQGPPAGRSKAVSVQLALRALRGEQRRKQRASVLSTQEARGEWAGRGR